MVKAVANSPPIYNRNVSYATNTAIVFSYESSYKHAMPMSKTDENIKNRSERLFLTKSHLQDVLFCLKTIGDYDLIPCMYLHSFETAPANLYVTSKRILGDIL